MGGERLVSGFVLGLDGAVIQDWNVDQEWKTYQVRQAVQLLAHHAALLPPARDLAVHEVEEQAKGQEGQCGVDVAARVVVLEAVPQGGEDGHDAAEAWGRGVLGQLVLDAPLPAGVLVPLSSVIRSARCIARIREKWPVSEERRSFCLSYAVVEGSRGQRFVSMLPACLRRRRLLVTGTYKKPARPFGHRRWWRRRRFSWTWRVCRYAMRVVVGVGGGIALAVSREEFCLQFCFCMVRKEKAE